MHTTTNLLFMFVPEKLVGTLLLLMLSAGGIALIVGAQRAGKALIITAISFPIISVIVSAMFNSFFDALPPVLVAPVAFLIMLAIYASVGWIIVKSIFGQEAVNHFKGELLFAGFRRFCGLLFTRVGMVLTGALLVILYVSIAMP